MFLAYTAFGHQVLMM